MKEINPKKIESGQNVKLLKSFINYENKQKLTFKNTGRNEKLLFQNLKLWEKLNINRKLNDH